MNPADALREKLNAQRAAQRHQELLAKNRDERAARTQAGEQARARRIRMLEEARAAQAAAEQQEATRQALLAERRLQQDKRAAEAERRAAAQAALLKRQREEQKARKLVDQRTSRREESKSQQRKPVRATVRAQERIAISQRPTSARRVSPDSVKVNRDRPRQVAREPASAQRQSSGARRVSPDAAEVNRDRRRQIVREPAPAQVASRRGEPSEARRAADRALKQQIQLRQKRLKETLAARRVQTSQEIRQKEQQADQKRQAAAAQQRQEQRQRLQRQAQPARQHETLLPSRQQEPRGRQQPEAVIARRLEKQLRRLEETARRAEQQQQQQQRLALQRAEQSSVRRQQQFDRQQGKQQRQESQALRREDQRLQARAARLSAARQERKLAAAARQQANEPRRQQSERRHQVRPATTMKVPRRNQRTATARAPNIRPTAPELESENLLWLSTGGNRIVDEKGSFIDLRGVTALGTDELVSTTVPDLRQVLALDDRNLTVLTDTWGVNVVRLPFQAETFLPRGGVVSLDFRLEQLDAVIDAIAQAGAYVLLALQAPTIGGLTPLPEDAAFQCWPLLADRYQDESAVLYELYAPNAPLADGWTDAAGKLIGAVRREHPASLIFVGSGNADSGIERLPLRFATGTPVHNTVYTIRVLPASAPIRDALALQAFAQSYPVFASQWLDGGLDLGRSAESASLLFERLEMGWTAGFWNAAPKLVANAAGHDFTATRFGLVVRRALTLPLRPQLAPFTRDG